MTCSVGSPVNSGNEEGEFSDLDVSFVSCQSIYIPTPQRTLCAHRLKFPYQIMCASWN